MATIYLRSTNDGPLTNEQIDANFTNLNNDKLDIVEGGTLSANVSLNDSIKLLFGTDYDLEIFHDGANSYIQNVGTGNLYIRGDDVFLQDGSGLTYLKTDNASSAVLLYHSNAEKLRTSSDGIYVSGDVSFNSYHISSKALAVGSTSATTLFTFPLASFGGAEATIVAKHNTDRHIIKLIMTHDGVTAISTEYSIVYTSQILTDYEVDIVGSDVRLVVTPSLTGVTYYNCAFTLLNS